MKKFLTLGLATLFLFGGVSAVAQESLKDEYERQRLQNMPGYGMKGCEGDNLAWCNRALYGLSVKKGEIVRAEVRIGNHTFACGKDGDSICEGGVVYLKKKNGVILKLEVQDNFDDLYD